MVRPFTGQGSLEAARKARDAARTADELRITLAILLSLEVGLNLTQTALLGAVPHQRPVHAVVHRRGCQPLSQREHRYGR